MQLTVVRCASASFATKCLGRRRDALGLHAGHVRRAQPGGQDRILPEALEVAAAERRADEVQHRPEHVLNAASLGLGADQPRQLGDEIDVPRRAEGRAAGRARGARALGKLMPRTPLGPSEVCIWARPSDAAPDACQPSEPAVSAAFSSMVSDRTSSSMRSGGIDDEAAVVSGLVGMLRMLAHHPRGQYVRSHGGRRFGRLICTPPSAVPGEPGSGGQES